MKRTTAALSIFAALCAASSAASAQSNVTIYGLVDVALVRESGGAVAGGTKITSGVGAGSRLGFRGTEDLGNGLSALFLLENGFQADTGAMGQGGLLFGRQAYVGLQSSRFGMLTLGRQYTPQYLAVAAIDPFGSGYAGDTKNLITATGNGTSRMDNTAKYTSPTVSGVVGELVYAPGEVANDSKAGRQFGGGLTWRGGPAMLRLGYHNRNNDTATVKTNSNARNLVAGGTYDIGTNRIHLAYVVNKGLNSALPRNAANPYGYATAPVPSLDSRDLLLGVTLPFGPHSVLASYIDKNDRTRFDQDAHQLALGYKYAVSKRTELYAVYAKISNQRGAGYTVGSAIEGGTGNRALDLGIKHAF
jgi:predicted porin